MNGLSPKPSIKDFFYRRGGVIISYLQAMRKYAFYLNTTKSRLSPRSIIKYYWGKKFRHLGLRLGFSIGPNSLGYGVIIPHYGTIVIHGDARIGNFAVIHTCTCVAGGNKRIGDYFYLSTGSQLVGNLSIGDGVTVAAHSLVNRSAEARVLLAGVPAIVKRRDYPLWFERDGSVFLKRVELVRRLLDSSSK